MNMHPQPDPWCRHALADCSLLQVHTIELLPIGGVSGHMLPVAGTWMWTAACHRGAATACHLSQVQAGSLPPVTASSGGLPTVVGSRQLPATCCRHKPAYCRLTATWPAVCHLLLVCASDKPSVGGMCWWPAASHWHAPMACHLTLVHDGSLPHLAGAGHCPEVSLQCVPAPYCLLLACARSQPPVGRRCALVAGMHQWPAA